MRKNKESLIQKEERERAESERRQKKRNEKFHEKFHRYDLKFETKDGKEIEVKRKPFSLWPSWTIEIYVPKPQSGYRVLFTVEYYSRKKKMLRDIQRIKELYGVEEKNGSP